MINHRQISRLVAGMCMFSALMACTQERNPCLQPVTAAVRIGCYQMIAVDTGWVRQDTFLPNAILGAKDDDSLRFLYYGSKGLSKFTILMSPLDDSCTWLFQPDSAVSSVDTLTFIYSRRLQFISGECGYSHQYYLKDIRATAHNIDSVILNNPTVDLDANAAEHVQIFF